MNRVHRVFYFAVAVVFASAIFAPGRVSAGPGDCTAYSAADIDTCFVAWADTNGGFDAVMDGILCIDNPAGTGSGGPVIRMDLTIAGGSLLRVGTNDFQAQLASFMPAECGTLVPGIGTPERHICRAEILRSFTWRQLCAQRVDRSPEN